MNNICHHLLVQHEKALQSAQLQPHHQMAPQATAHPVQVKRGYNPFQLWAKVRQLFTAYQNERRNPYRIASRMM
jgi:hypothetical protein